MKKQVMTLECSPIQRVVNIKIFIREISMTELMHLVKSMPLNCRFRIYFRSISNVHDCMNEDLNIASGGCM